MERHEVERTFNAIVERDARTGILVGSVPGWPGAHSQGETLDELVRALTEVIEMLLEDGDPKLESEFVGDVHDPERIGVVEDSVR